MTIDQMRADLVDIADFLMKSDEPEYARVIDAAVDRIHQTAAFDLLLAACQMEELYDAWEAGPTYDNPERKALDALYEVHGITEFQDRGQFRLAFRRAAIAAALPPTAALTKEKPSDE